jgi:hypothetical protein
MAFPTPATLQNLSIPNREAGWYHPNDGKRDQFLLKIPFVEMEMATDAFQLNRANIIPSVPFLGRAAAKTNPATNVTLNSFEFQRIAENINLDTYDSISGRMSDNLEMAARGIKLGILRELALQVIEGVASPNILGLKSLSAANTTGAGKGAPNGGFMTLADIDLALYNVAPTDDFLGGGAASCAVLNPKTLRELVGLIQASSNSERGIWKKDDELGARVFVWRGIKWYFSDFVSLTETKGTGTNLTSIYFVKCNGPTGLRLAYARDPNIEDVNEFGIHQYPIPISQNQNIRGIAIEGFYALVAPEARIVSRLDGIDPTQFAL